MSRTEDVIPYLKDGWVDEMRRLVIASGKTYRELASFDEGPSTTMIQQVLAGNITKKSLSRMCKVLKVEPSHFLKQAFEVNGGGDEASSNP